MSCIILLFLTPMCALRWHGKQTSQPKNSEKAHNAPERKANTVEVGVGRNGARVTNYCFTLHTFNCSEPSFGAVLAILPFSHVRGSLESGAPTVFLSLKGKLSKQNPSFGQH